MILLDNNFIDGLTSSDLTASSATDYLPALNVLNRQPTKPWRTGAGTTHTVLFDFAGAVTVDAIAVFAHKFSGGAISQVKFNFGTTSACADAEEIMSATTNEVWLKLPAVALTYRYVKLTITQASSGVVDVARVHIGSYLVDETYSAAQIGVELSKMDLSTAGTNSHGERFIDQGDYITILRFNFQWNTFGYTSVFQSFISNYGFKKSFFLRFRSVSYYGWFRQTGRNYLISANALTTNDTYSNDGWEFVGYTEIQLDSI